MGTTDDIRRHSTYEPERVSRADALYDKMPLPSISDVLDVPLTTLQSWKSRGWISTDIVWKNRRGGRERKATPRQAARLVFDQGLTRREAAERLGVHPRTVRKYLAEYRDGPKPGPKPEGEK
jgi:transposase